MCGTITLTLITAKGDIKRMGNPDENRKKPGPPIVLFVPDSEMESAKRWHDFMSTCLDIGKMAGKNDLKEGKSPLPESLPDSLPEGPDGDEQRRVWTEELEEFIYWRALYWIGSLRLLVDPTRHTLYAQALEDYLKGFRYGYIEALRAHTMRLEVSRQDTSLYTFYDPASASYAFRIYAPIQQMEPAEVGSDDWSKVEEHMPVLFNQDAPGFHSRIQALLEGITTMDRASRGDWAWGEGVFLDED